MFVASLASGSQKDGILRTLDSRRGPCFFPEMDLAATGFSTGLALLQVQEGG